MPTSPSFRRGRAAAWRSGRTGRPPNRCCACAFRITTVRNPAAPRDDGIALRRAVQAGEVLGPRIVTAGAALNRTSAPFGPFHADTSTDDVRAAVRTQADAGVDWIKVYSTLSPEHVAAAVE